MKNYKVYGNSIAVNNLDPVMNKVARVATELGYEVSSLMTCGADFMAYKMIKCSETELGDLVELAWGR